MEPNKLDVEQPQKSFLGDQWEWSQLQDTAPDTNPLDSNEHAYSETTNHFLDTDPMQDILKEKRSTLVDIKPPSVHTAVTIQRASFQDHSRDFVGNPMLAAQYGDDYQYGDQQYQPYEQQYYQEQDYEQDVYVPKHTEQNEGYLPFVSPQGTNLYHPAARHASYQSAMSQDQFKRKEEDNDTFVLAKEDEPSKVKKPKRICCCFKTCWGCSLVFLLILLALGVGIYFIFPQVPTVDISEPYIPAGTTGFLINGQSVTQVDTATVLNSGTFNLTMQLANDISIYSPSFINFGVKTLELYAQPKQPDGSLLTNFQGFGQQTNLRFPSRTVTNFTIPLGLVYTTSFASALSLALDPAIQLFSTACLAIPQRRIPVQLKVRMEISAISWLGIWPSFTWDREQPCPDRALVLEMVNKFAQRAQ